jgi:hypothetical protein
MTEKQMDMAVMLANMRSLADRDEDELPTRDEAYRARRRQDLGYE